MVLSKARGSLCATARWMNSPICSRRLTTIFEPGHPFFGCAPAERLESLYGRTAASGAKCRPPDRIDLLTVEPCREKSPGRPSAARPSRPSAPSGSALLYARYPWPFRGALDGAYNAIVDADSHPDWRLDPTQSWPRPCARSDMAKILGLSPNDFGIYREIDASLREEDPLPDNDFIQTFDKPG